MKTITYFGDRTRRDTFFIIVSASRTRITRSLGSNVFNMCYISSCIPLPLRFAPFRNIIPMCFNFNLTYGLKPHVSGIKIATVYRRSIFKVEGL